MFGCIFSGILRKFEQKEETLWRNFLSDFNLPPKAIVLGMTLFLGQRSLSKEKMRLPYPGDIYSLLVYITEYLFHKATSHFVDIIKSILLHQKIKCHNLHHLLLNSYPCCSLSAEYTGFIIQPSGSKHVSTQNFSRDFIPLIIIL